MGKLFLKSKGIRNTTLGSGYRGVGRKRGLGWGSTQVAPTVSAASRV